MTPQVTIQHARGSELLGSVRQLRYEILRKPHGLTFESTAFPGDEEESTLHLLAYASQLDEAELSDEMPLIGCVTLMFNHPDTVQLRGMAVAAETQRTGIGRLLLQEAEAVAQASNRDIWCNARHSAFGFYERNGWIMDGELFDVPVIGVHSVMKKSLKGGYEA